MERKILAAILLVIYTIGIAYGTYRFVMTHQNIWVESETIYAEVFGNVDFYE